MSEEKRPFFREGSTGAPWALHWLAIPICHLFAYTSANEGMSDWTYPWFLAAWFWGISALLYVALSLVLRHPRKAGAVLSLFLLAFFAHRVVDKGWVVPMWTGSAVLSVALVAWRGRLDVLTTLGNLFAGLAFASFAWELGRVQTTDFKPDPDPKRFEALKQPPKKSADHPDIWYIVLDGYGREDVLADLYRHRPKLAEELRKRGFYVADRAHSNYAQTALSFAATMNMGYVPTLLENDTATSKYRLVLRDLIRDSVVEKGLRDAGYRVVQLNGEYSVTQLVDADEERAPFHTWSEYEYVFTSRTAMYATSELLGLPQSYLPHLIRRRHIAWTLNDMQRGDRWDGPTFVYAHIVAPHPPFLFKPDGSYRVSKARSTFVDGDSWFRVGKAYPEEKYDEGYNDFVRWLDDQVLAVVDAALKTSDRPPIIILQGDHGPAMNLRWGSKAKSDMRERMSILSAYYVPESMREDLYPTITPVNTFRLVFNEVLGGVAKPLPDRSFFATWSKPFLFLDVTKELRERDDRDAHAGLLPHVDADGRALPPGTEPPPPPLPPEPVTPTPAEAAAAEDPTPPHEH